MYTPRPFEETRHAHLAALVREHPLATVVTQGADGPLANALPLELGGDGRLRGHAARGNPLLAADGAEVLVVFHGPDAYVSPAWYPSKRVDGRAVPTWNYAVVQARGRLRVVEERDWLLDCLRTLSARHEAGLPRPWRVDEAPPGYVDQLLRGIAGIEIEVDDLRGKFKLSQNHPDGNRHGVIEGLRRRARRGDAELAAMMAAGDTGHPA